MVLQATAGNIEAAAQEVLAQPDAAADVLDDELAPLEGTASADEVCHVHSSLHASAAVLLVLFGLL